MSRLLTLTVARRCIGHGSGMLGRLCEPRHHRRRFALAAWMAQTLARRRPPTSPAKSAPPPPVRPVTVKKTQAATATATEVMPSPAGIPLPESHRCIPTTINDDPISRPASRHSADMRACAELAVTATPKAIAARPTTTEIGPAPRGHARSSRCGTCSASVMAEILPCRLTHRTKGQRQAVAIPSAADPPTGERAAARPATSSGP